MNFIVAMYYENTLDAFETRLNTIKNKKGFKIQREITSLKMMIVVIKNLLKDKK